MRAEPERGLERGDGAVVLGLVVGGAPERARGAVELRALLVVEDGAVGRGPGVAARSAVGVGDDGAGRSFVGIGQSVRLPLRAEDDLETLVAHDDAVDEVAEERLLLGDGERAPAVQEAGEGAPPVAKTLAGV